MSIVERVFEARPNINKIQESLKNQQASGIVCYNIVESFINSFEKGSNEIVQLMSMSEVSEIPKSPKFFKSVLSVDGRFSRVVPLVEIESEEYYEKLLSASPNSMAIKIRVIFNLKGIEYTLDYTPDDDYSAVKVSYKKGNGEESPEFFSFGALPLGDELPFSLEESFYNFISKKI